jgi:hypothetical protein
MATATKEKPKKKEKEVEEEVVEAVEEDELGDEIEALEGASLEDVPINVERTLIHPETGEEKTFNQHEMPYLTKLKFFRLLSGTIRLASTDETGTVTDFLVEIFQPVQDAMSRGLTPEEAERIATGEFINTVMRFVELVPDFAENLYLYALNVKPADEVWVTQALETLDDETGVDILDVFIGQNGKAIKRFFTKHLRKVGARINQIVGSVGTDQE